MIEKQSNSNIVNEQEEQNFVEMENQEEDFLDGICPYDGSTESCESCQ